ncbi:hypothetical protein ABIB75_007260 [Bradyrhizobium sp. GM2.2]|uniref:hypothetical protein n=1 Tax=unclassified Bradyrhizobium TaxID=2631580 RepID=UPI001FF9FB6C|nr:MULTISPECIES: hypothetical protein [unclassified Bradyrhizobium]MCK1272947.1 hypothetical protein [Bradyrhizobium sp. 84]MCK1373042.1 hypothetical protein [Bradyrhizobium sp. 49]MCK1429206.1 hypothetical protein [Bradyrhizobium sp. 87]
MTARSNFSCLQLLSARPVLTSESQEEFDALAIAMIEYIKPDDPIRESWVMDVIQATWEIVRYQRTRTALIQSQYRNALSNLLQHVADVNELIALHLADGWFGTRAGKQEVAKRLEPFSLNETAIEAEAIRMVFPDLEVLDSLLTSALKRRNKALRLLSESEAPLARRAREVSNRIIAENEAEGRRSERAE